MGTILRDTFGSLNGYDFGPTELPLYMLSKGSNERIAEDFKKKIYPPKNRVSKLAALLYMRVPVTVAELSKISTAELWKAIETAQKNLRAHDGLPGIEVLKELAVRTFSPGSIKQKVGGSLIMNFSNEYGPSCLTYYAYGCDFTCRYCHSAPYAYLPPPPGLLLTGDAFAEQFAWWHANWSTCLTKALEVASRYGFTLSEENKQRLSLNPGLELAGGDPSLSIPFILDCLSTAKAMTQHLPFLAYVSHGASPREAYRLMESFADLHIMSLRHASRTCSKILCGREDYPERCLDTIHYLSGNKENHVIVRIVAFPEPHFTCCVKPLPELILRRGITPDSVHLSIIPYVAGEVFGAKELRGMQQVPLHPVPGLERAATAEDVLATEAIFRKAGFKLVSNFKNQEEFWR